MELKASACKTELVVYFVFITLALLVGFVYYPSLDAYFTADDFWHIPHLYQALSLGHPEMLWQNFCGPWVGKTTFYLFYRPITELTLAADYLLFGNKAPGYHLTSILFHYVNCVLVYFVALKILSLSDKNKNEDKRRDQLVSFLVAAIFAVHPSQAEAVSWILARADLVGAFFCLISIYAALLYFEKKKTIWYMTMLVSMLFAFGAKELCAGLPFILFIVFYSLNRNFKQTLKLVAVPFGWLISFLLIRAWTLGAVLGGYVGTHGYKLNESLLERIFIPYVWWKLAHPINEHFISDYFVYDSALRFAYIVVAALIVLNICFSQSLNKRFVLSCILFSVVMLLMAVNFQVWTVCNSMAGSRIFYLLLFPLALSVANIVFPSSLEIKNLKTNKILFWSAISAGILLVGTFSILCNLGVQAWRSAGVKTQSMQKQIAQKIDSMPPQKKLAIINLPPIIDGTVSIFVPDFLSGLMLPPLSSKDYWHRIICLDSDLKTVNMQNMKDLALDPNIEIVFWDQKTNSMDPTLKTRLRQAELDQLKYTEPLKIEHQGEFECLDWRITKNKDFYNNKKEGTQISTYRLSPPVEAQIGRDLILTLSKISKAGNENLSLKNLIYVSFDDSSERTNIDHPPLIFELPKQTNSANIVVPLSQEKSWLAVLPQKDLRVDLPVCFKLDQARMINCDSLKPKLALKDKIEQEPNGYFGVDDSHKKLTFYYSCSHMKEASGALVEISKPNCFFTVYTGTLRDIKSSEHALKSIKLNQPQGIFSIPVSEFPQPAYYQIRIAPLSKEGRIISAFGDPVSMSLFNPNKN